MVKQKNSFKSFWLKLSKGQIKINEVTDDVFYSFPYVFRIGLLWHRRNFLSTEERNLLNTLMLRLCESYKANTDASIVDYFIDFGDLDIGQIDLEEIDPLEIDSEIDYRLSKYMLWSLENFPMGNTDLVQLAGSLLFGKFQQLSLSTKLTTNLDFIRLMRFFMRKGLLNEQISSQIRTQIPLLNNVPTDLKLGTKELSIFDDFDDVTKIQLAVASLSDAELTRKILGNQKRSNLQYYKGVIGRLTDEQIEFAIDANPKNYEYVSNTSRQNEELTVRYIKYLIDNNEAINSSFLEKVHLTNRRITQLIFELPFNSDVFYSMNQETRFSYLITHIMKGSFVDLNNEFYLPKVYFTELTMEQREGCIKAFNVRKNYILGNEIK